MRQSTSRRYLLTLSGAVLLFGCADDVPLPSIDELLDDPIRLEATVVRCAQNRRQMRYEAECVNARQAVSILEAREERARREALELQSEQKREELRRAQQALDEARRQAAEAERLREEAEYLAQFDEPTPGSAGNAMPAADPAALAEPETAGLDPGNPPLDQ